MRATQIRDAGLFHTPEGIARLLVPCGEGVIRWEEVLAALIDQAPRLTLSIEGIDRSNGELPLYLNDPVWISAHPDMTVAELSEIVRMTNEHELRAEAGNARSLEVLRQPVTEDQSLTYISDSARHLRRCLEALGPLGRLEALDRLDELDGLDPLTPLDADTRS
ncbi:hypothetical protein [Nocardioides kongjuensis]|uniref:Sugar phosphate isomerase/epimerase n=1 Tax=Nocardioides kongjuensis TaxID=349522 RepID=A0A852RRG1_9ACTN|nr:hypothetical protein [Nocardioides kongjuensis]NYD33289.1 sugar phosphate isomerase/epimerase [Nocardioides kongjuensis]